jgi:RHS repeat-associated protein
MTVSFSSVTNLFTYDAMGNQTAATGGRGHQKSAKPKAQPQGDRDFEAVRTRGARSGIPRRSGNRNTVHAAHDGADNRYAANGLNPYTSVSTFMPFVPLCELIPVFDADGNQTLVRTEIGVWDLTEPDAACPLLLNTPSGWFTFGFDQVKNVTELFDSSGNIAAAYDHAPFGATLSAAGPAAAPNPFRFSSEVWDATLGLVCYTFRPYNPLDGRFTNRDPIGEQGGLNLYGFAGNDPVNKTDTLGLQVLPSSGRYFNTMDIAAVETGKFWIKDTIINTWENCGSVCKTCIGNHVQYYTTHIRGNTIQFSPHKAKCYSKDQVAAFWHTHSYPQPGSRWIENDENGTRWLDQAAEADFSESDRRYAHGWELPSYLTTPRGTGRFDPDIDTGNNFDGGWTGIKEGGK